MNDLPEIETIPFPFAKTANKNTAFNKISTTIDNAMSLQGGFPAVFSKLVNEGGKFLNREDFNGILYLLSLSLQYLQTGGLIQYNPTLATEIGGYPAGARLWWKDTTDRWILIESKNGGNSTEPAVNGSNIDDVNGTDSIKPWKKVMATLDKDMSDDSTNGVQNKVIKAYVDGKTTNVGDTEKLTVSELGCLKVWIGSIADLPDAGKRSPGVFYFALKT